MDRYDRHRPLLSERAWQGLVTTPIVCAGAGGLGSFVLELLVRLGPLQLEVWDPGSVDTPDLNRQILYTPEDLDQPKAEAARRRLRSVNPECRITAVSARLTGQQRPEAGGSGATPAFVLFDCVDSFPERGGLRELQEHYRCPIFHGGVEGFFGQAALFAPGGPGYEEAFGPGWREIPPSRKPVLPSVCAAVASLQVGSYLRWLESRSSIGPEGKLILFDGKTMETRSVRISGGQ